MDAVCRRYRMPNRTRRLALQVCRHHLDCHRLLEARPGTVMKLLERLDALRHGDVTEFVQACEADFRGREGREGADYPQGRRLHAALHAARAINARDLAADGLQGPELGAALRRARIEAIAQLPVEPGE